MNCFATVYFVLRLRVTVGVLHPLSEDEGWLVLQEALLQCRGNKLIFAQSDSRSWKEVYNTIPDGRTHLFLSSASS